MEKNADMEMKNDLPTKVVIATWFHADNDLTASRFSAVDGNSTSDKFQAVYWRCVLVFFGSSLRWNSDCKHVFITNLTELPHVDGISVADWFDNHGIEVIPQVALSRVTPEGFWGMWRNQFYVFDALKALYERLPETSTFLLFDSDCIWLAPHGRLTSIVAKEGAALLTLPYETDHVANGLRVCDIAAIGQTLLGVKTPGESLYHGGEMQACDRKSLKFLTDHVDALFAANLEAFRNGRPYLKEEAHFLSVLYSQMGVRPATANAVIRRIWTGPNYYNLLPTDADLDIWHVPSEKQGGLARLFRKAINERSWFWHADTREFRNCVGRFVGIPRRSKWRWFWLRVINRIKRCCASR
jgi:hypothetical protein